jgi:hypothetical protein
VNLCDIASWVKQRQILYWKIESRNTSLFNA